MGAHLAMALMAVVCIGFPSWRTGPPLFPSCLALIGALDRDAQQPFCYTYCMPLYRSSNVLLYRDCSESTGLPPEDVYRKVRVRTFELGGQHDVRSRGVPPRSKRRDHR